MNNPVRAPSKATGEVRGVYHIVLYNRLKDGSLQQMHFHPRVYYYRFPRQCFLARVTTHPLWPYSPFRLSYCAHARYPFSSYSHNDMQ